MFDEFTGEGVEFENATLTQGFDCSAGYFTSTNAATGIEIESGILMSTMGVDFGFGGSGSGSEPDLTLQLDEVNAINSNMLNNIIVLEFDFRPISDQISFEYVFGSEEYPMVSIISFFLNEETTEQRLGLLGHWRPSL